MKTEVGINIYLSTALFRPIIAHPQIKILLKGHQAMNKKHSSKSKAGQCQIARTILEGETLFVMVIHIRSFLICH